MIDSANAYRRILDDAEQQHPHRANSGVLRLARALADQEEQGFSCQACDESLPVFVDDEVAGLDVARKYPDVKHHLDMCPRCVAAYVQLLQLAWLMDRGQLTIDPAATPLRLDFLAESVEGDQLQ